MARRSSAREILLAPVHAIAGIAPDRNWRVPWLATTATLGLGFLVGQWLAWSAVQSHGFHVSTAGMSPFFYLLTGAHAIHLTVGVFALLYATVISLLRFSIEHRRIVIEVASWYWHFMGVLWVYIFALLEFGR
jgi:cytochrome c oxidase subunit 3